ncbi:hypothetical protein A3A03_00900 [Candidatus Nomurabacteria bacterium RIFCSPLOWO2_01_FULL_40_18]|uniref:TGS domain-containing protein n=1 Tax=Candidatus Nomurabacteria bacterium RIFCSPLOWO2_01_FULL_40_18 TaxID=1801773 RepID=A0A1F6XI50_9BACT|nr:MAG: hypothetical protein A3A03_00900 [Candidatus Nomurabacteria bacterium RIFCSPLOWO2_01_FULL_40_18]
MLQEILKLTNGFTKKEEELIIKAYKFAERAHEGQKRMSGEPYIIHPFEIAKTLVALGMDSQTIAAGILHDVLEDTNITEKELEEEFGSEILFLVNGVTNLNKLKYHGHTRYVESLRKFFFAITSDLRVVIIKFADRLHNLKTLQYLREDKRKRIAVESIEVYAALANRLGMGKLKGELEDAAFPFAYPKEYAQIEKVLKENQNTYKKNLAKIKTRLEEELEKNKIKVIEIDHRMKRKYSVWRKLTKLGIDIEKVYDMVALRVVVESVEDCYRVLGIIHSIWSPLPGTIRDYIALPKVNGYQSLHTSVFADVGGTAEIQIRTKEMHEKAAYGIAAHFAYKEQSGRKKYDEKLKFKWLEELKGLNYKPNETKEFIEHLKIDFFSDRIFVFTPQGDVLDLPEDSTPIDFAYAIHSDIGNHIASAKINGKMSQIFSKLQNKDIVEIITKKNARPSGKWLQYAKTTFAKKHIRSFLEKNSLLTKLKSFGRS